MSVEQSGSATERNEGQPQGATQAGPVDPVRYNRFIEGIELDNVRFVLADMNAPRLPDGRKIRPEVELFSDGYVNGEGWFRVNHRLNFSGHHEDDGLEALHVNAVLEAQYRSAVPMVDSIFAEFQRVNLPLNTWPYFREFLQSMLVRAGWPPFVLPAFRVSPSPLASQTRGDE